MAINPDRPVGTPPPATTQSQPAPAPAQASVSVTESDALTVQVKKGDTLFQFARLYADDQNYDGSITGKELTGFVDGIKKANGGNPAMAVGQPIRIPAKDATFKVELGIAVQKWLAANPQSGKGEGADYDWAGLQFAGLMDGSAVTLTRKDGTTEQFVVHEDMSGESDEVAVTTMAEYIKAMGLDE
jgi:hypothetical protein